MFNFDKYHLIQLFIVIDQDHDKNRICCKIRMQKTFLVSGGNRGIGREIVRQILSQSNNHRVYLATRDTNNIIDRQELSSNCEIVSLDVTSDESVNQLIDHLKSNEIKINTLINNAGYSGKGFNQQVANQTMQVNYYGVKRLTERLLQNDLFKPSHDSRIIMMSSRIAVLDGGWYPMTPKLELFKYTTETLSEKDVDDMVSEFISVASSEQTATDNGWPANCYRVSKIALNAYAQLLAKRLKEQDISVNYCCPGWCRTGLGGDRAPRSAAEGAQTCVWLATSPRSEINCNGCFFYDKKPINFINEKLEQWK
jgi:carbonyl reductase 1